MKNKDSFICARIGNSDAVDKQKAVGVFPVRRGGVEHGACSDACKQDNMKPGKEYEPRRLVGDKGIGGKMNKGRKCDEGGYSEFRFISSFFL